MDACPTTPCLSLDGDDLFRTTTNAVGLELEMGETSPLAEHWYWQCDGIDGLVCLCAPCARSLSGQAAKDQESPQPPA